MEIKSKNMTYSYRSGSQFLMPSEKPVSTEDGYDIYPSFNIGNDKIFNGLSSLAAVIAKEKIVLIDGYAGVFFEQIRDELHRLITTLFGKMPLWIFTGDYFRSEDEINALLLPFLGGDDPLFGRRSNVRLSEYFKIDTKLPDIGDRGLSPVIIYGVGASLFSDTGLLVYIDIPKNELLFRSRAGSITNIGMSSPSAPKEMYKRFYFADWVSLNNHKKDILERINIFADGQRPDDINWMKGDDLRSTLDIMSRSVFRVRPWFEPGAWGGTWIRNKINGLSGDVANYAWSYELITPENGIIIESSGLILECSFDLIMYHSAKNILGDCFGRFGTDFPIRFDFLDTFDGGNLSMQVHPQPGYMKNNFGEEFTQEETYYILDTKNKAVVYLGFNSGIDKDEFRTVLEKSSSEGNPVDIEKFVQVHPARKHDLFLIPYGTIHGSGKNNLVLEISSTPYIFTFKLYDWLRPDLDGSPRTLNIVRGMENLFFDRNGDMVRDKLISKPVLTGEGGGWQLFHLPTHESHLYDVYRYHISSSVEVFNNGKCHVLNLVEGTSVTVTVMNGSTLHIKYAETFIIPAAAESYIITNRSENPAMVVVAFVK
jgi:mannose-6-phosphate isomerase class I